MGPNSKTMSSPLLTRAAKPRATPTLQAPPVYRPAQAESQLQRKQPSHGRICSPDVRTSTMAPPPAYRLGQELPSVQAKLPAVAGAPPVYRPAQAESQLQRKQPSHGKICSPNARTSTMVPPPAYRLGQELPSVQAKLPAVAGAPPVYRPSTPGVAAAERAHIAAGSLPVPVQRKVAAAVAASRYSHLLAPTTYRPVPANAVQQKPAQLSSSARMTESAVVQRNKTFQELIGAGGYSSKPAFIMSLSTDEKLEQDKRYRFSAEFYKTKGCRVVNENSVTYDTGTMNSNLTTKQAKKVKLALKKDGDAVLVITGHGNLQWLLGNSPFTEGQHIPAFVQHIKNLENQLSVTFHTVVLDSCWSGAELKDPIIGLGNDSTARQLSAALGVNYSVLGANGKAADGNVNYLTSDGKETKSDYEDNMIVFVNGQVTGGSKHKENGKGITHSTAYMGNPAYDPINDRAGTGRLYRTNSFSGTMTAKV